MPYANLTPVFEETDLQLAQQDLLNCQSRLPFLVNLTYEEKTSYLRLGASTSAFMLKTLIHYQNNPHLHLSYLPLAEWQNDYAVYRRLEALLLQMQSLEEAISDTLTALRMENVNAGLTFYKMVKAASTQNVPGIDSILDDLKPMMPGILRNRKKGKKEEKK